MAVLIRDHITTEFVPLESGLTLVIARERLLGSQYGVVVDQTGQPVSLVVAEDLDHAEQSGASSLLDPRAGLPPAIVIGADLDFDVLVASGAITALDFRARGVIALGGDQGEDPFVAGVLPVGAIDDYLGAGLYGIPPKTLGAGTSRGWTAPAGTMLPGGISVPELQVTCAARVQELQLIPYAVDCGHVNRVAFLDANHMPICLNPTLPQHLLVQRM